MRRCTAYEKEPVARAREADVAEAPLLLDLLGSFIERACGKTPPRGR